MSTLAPPTKELEFVERYDSESYTYRYYVKLTLTDPNEVSHIQLTDVRLDSTREPDLVETAANTVTCTWDVTDFPTKTEFTVSGDAQCVTNIRIDGTVAELTESARQACMRPVSVFGTAETAMVYLKAFVRFPTEANVLYGRWEYSADGIIWSELANARPAGYEFTATPVADLRLKFDTFGNVEDYASDEPPVYDVHNFYVLNGDSETDSIQIRYDVCPVSFSAIKSNMQVRFRAVQLSTDTQTIDGQDYPKVRYEVGRAVLLPIFGPKTEVLYSDLPSASKGDVLYYNKSVYTYGTTSKQAMVYASDASSLVRPLSKAIDLDTTGSDTVTVLIPWRNYLIAATEHSLHLITKSENGFYTKIINSSIGIPKQDGKCCVSVLNGVLFKSGDRIFQLYPNLYSGEDTILNITDVSKPILHELLDLGTNSTSFALSTEEAYYVFIPGSGHTTCLKYNYTLRVWTKFEYPVVLTDTYVIGVDDIRVFGTHNNHFCEFRIERDLNQYLDELPAEFPESARPLLLYGDYVNKTLGSLDSDKNGSDGHTPILFVFDSGQKTDRIAYTKQFTEAKVMCVTESQRDSFPCVVQVAVDGELRVHTIQVNTDSPFWKTDSGFRTNEDTDDILMSLSRNVYSDSADILNTMRQLIVRYSGKGHTVRFVLQGNSVCRFRIHSVLSRYRTLNVKQ